MSAFLPSPQSPPASGRGVCGWTLTQAEKKVIDDTNTEVGGSGRYSSHGKRKEIVVMNIACERRCR